MQEQSLEQSRRLLYVKTIDEGLVRNTGIERKSKIKSKKNPQSNQNAHGVYFKMRASQPYIAFFAIHPMIPDSLIGVFQIANPSVCVK
jgi:hypothetical protein